MNALFRFDSGELWHLVGWTMLHFLWLGTLVGVAAGACRLCLRRAAPNVRYVMSVAALLALALLPFAIATWLAEYSRPVQAQAEEVNPVNPARGEAANILPGPVDFGVVSPLDDASAESSSLNIAAFAEPLAAPDSQDNADVGFAGELPGGLGLSTPPSAFVELLDHGAAYLPWVWFVGSPITLALLATGVIGTRRLRRACRSIDDGSIVQLLAQLAESMRVSRRIGIAVCERVASPVLIGIVRPTILLPPAVLTGWSPDEIEMVLLHELAHVRRWDNAVNFAQRLVESLLFFHPAVWLVSNWIRREREACCDAIVVCRTNRPHAYAELLVALAAQMPRSVLFHPAASSAMAAGPLRKRIRQILQMEDDPMLVSGKSFVIVLASALVAATLAVLYLPAFGQAGDPAAGVTPSTTEASELTTEGTGGDVNAVELPDAAAPAADQAIELAPLTDPLAPPGSAGGQLAPDDYAQLASAAAAVDASAASSNAAQSGEGLDWSGKPIGPDSTHDWWGNPIKKPGDAQNANDPVLLQRRLIELRKETTGRDPFAASPNIDQVLSATSEAATDSERIVETQNIPAELHDQVVTWHNNSEAYGRWVGDTRLILQAPRSVHVHLRTLLKAAQTWNASAAERADRAARPLVRSMENNEPRLAWRTFGLTLGTIIQKPQGRGPVPESNVVVTAVESGSPASWQAIQPGNIISSVEGFRTYSLGEMESVVKSLIENFRGRRELVRLRLYRLRSNSWAQVNLSVPLETEIAGTESGGTSIDRYNWAATGAAPSADGDERGPVTVRGGSGTRGGESSNRGMFGRRGESADRSEAMGRSRGGFGRRSQSNDDPIGGGDSNSGRRRASSAAGTTRDSTEVEEVESSAFAARFRAYQPPPGKRVARIMKDATADSVSTAIKELHEQGYKISMTSSIDDFTLLLVDEKPAKSPFPSLEDQKLADLIWKRMQLELEPIGADDLKRVRALGYDGGVRIAAIGSTSTSQDSWQSNDILVGLHVWPTTNMEDIVEVLEREDLAELNPLKFYVVRQQPQYDPNAKATGDEVRTGRVTVSIDGGFGRGFGSFGGGRGRRSSSTRASAPTPTLIPSPAPREGEAPSTTLVPTTSAPSDAVPREPVLTPGESTFVEPELTPNVAPVKSEASSTTTTIVPAESPKATTATTTATEPSQATPNTSATSTAPPQLFDPNAQTSQLGTYLDTAVGQRKPVLRYEGKTFDEWRSTWQTELSLEKRLEAVKALAAFGAAGRGQEAATAILEILQQYDWARLGNNDFEKQLQNVATGAFVGGAQSIPMQEWLPIVIERLRTDNQGDQTFSWTLLQRLDRRAEYAADQLLELTRKESNPLRVAALKALLQVDPRFENKTHADRWQELLTSGNSDDIESALSALSGNSGSIRSIGSDWLPLLLHPNESLQRRARLVFGNARWDDASAEKLRASLLAILEDGERVDDHLAVIRALGSLQRQAVDAYVSLEKVIYDRDRPLAVRVAAAKALGRIANTDFQNELENSFLYSRPNPENYQNTPEFRLLREQFKRAWQAEP
jgi:beta-lactamase regulating signal transducer with metallopeptidase domain